MLPIKWIESAQRDSISVDRRDIFRLVSRAMALRQNRIAQPAQLRIR